jgi:hypothetical protein
MHLPSTAAGPYPYESSLDASGVALGISSSRYFAFVAQMDCAECCQGVGRDFNQATHPKRLVGGRCCFRIAPHSQPFAGMSDLSSTTATSATIGPLPSYGLAPSLQFDYILIRPTQDTQSVTVQYATGQSSMTSYMIPGSPYLTFQYAKATPILSSSNGGIQSVNGVNVTTGTNSTYCFVVP